MLLSMPKMPATAHRHRLGHRPQHEPVDIDEVQGQVAPITFEGDVVLGGDGLYRWVPRDPAVGYTMVQDREGIWHQAFSDQVYWQEQSIPGVGRRAVRKLVKIALIIAGLWALGAGIVYALEHPRDTSPTPTVTTEAPATTAAS